MIGTRDERQVTGEGEQPRKNTEGEKGDSETPRYFYRVIGGRLAEIEIVRSGPALIFCKRSADTGYGTRFKRDEVEFDKLQALRVGIVKKRNAAEQCRERARELDNDAESLSKLLKDLEAR